MRDGLELERAFEDDDDAPTLERVLTPPVFVEHDEPPTLRADVEQPEVAATLRAHVEPPQVAVLPAPSPLPQPRNVPRSAPLLLHLTDEDFRRGFVAKRWSRASTKPVASRSRSRAVASIVIGIAVAALAIAARKTIASGTHAPILVEATVQVAEPGAPAPQADPAPTATSLEEIVESKAAEPSGVVGPMQGAIAIAAPPPNAALVANAGAKATAGAKANADANADPKADADDESASADPKSATAKDDDDEVEANAKPAAPSAKPAEPSAEESKPAAAKEPEDPSFGVTSAGF